MIEQYFPGIPDEQFIRGNIPMTKTEIRVLALAKARIRRTDTVIDVGAGTGSLSVEAAFQASMGKVYAVEREAEGISLIKANAARFGLEHIVAVQGEAPAALSNLPEADVILVGGSGGKLVDILARTDELLKLGGRLIVMAVTPETLTETLTLMKKKENYHLECAGIQVTRLRPAGEKHLFQSLNPVYIIVCEKRG